MNRITRPYTPEIEWLFLANATFQVVSMMAFCPKSVSAGAAFSGWAWTEHIDFRGCLFAFIYICKWCTCVTFMHGHICVCSFTCHMRKWGVEMEMVWKWAHFQMRFCASEDVEVLHTSLARRALVQVTCLTGCGFKSHQHLLFFATPVGPKF